MLTVRQHRKNIEVHKPWREIKCASSSEYLCLAVVEHNPVNFTIFHFTKPKI